MYELVLRGKCLSFFTAYIGPCCSSCNLLVPVGYHVMRANEVCALTYRNFCEPNSSIHFSHSYSVSVVEDNIPKM